MSSLSYRTSCLTLTAALLLGATPAAAQSRAIDLIRDFQVDSNIAIDEDATACGISDFSRYNQDLVNAGRSAGLSPTKSSQTFLWFNVVMLKVENQDLCAGHVTVEFYRWTYIDGVEVPAI